MKPVTMVRGWSLDSSPGERIILDGHIDEHTILSNEYVSRKINVNAHVSIFHTYEVPVKKISGNLHDNERYEKTYNMVAE